LGQSFAKISHKTNKSPLSIPLTWKWWKEANLTLEQLINLKPFFQKSAEWLRMGVEEYITVENSKLRRVWARFAEQLL
jgi:hypothetical protein